MADGQPCPDRHDDMAVVAEPLVASIGGADDAGRGRDASAMDAGLNMVLIRNHERGASTPFNAPDMYGTGDIGNGAQLAANNPANITVSPRGGLLLCEDGGSSPDQYGPGSRLIGLTSSGESYYFAKNNAELTDIQIAGAEKSVPEGDDRDSEFCGACRDPRGETLFVNMQSPGITFSITGPWRRGNQ